jgi:hypothetical protein
MGGYRFLSMTIPAPTETEKASIARPTAVAMTVIKSISFLL